VGQRPPVPGAGAFVAEWSAKLTGPVTLELGEVDAEHLASWLRTAQARDLHSGNFADGPFTAFLRRIGWLPPDPLDVLLTRQRLIASVRAPVVVLSGSQAGLVLHALALCWDQEHPPYLVPAVPGQDPPGLAARVAHDAFFARVKERLGAR
jgi:hypothetical protein